VIAAAKNYDIICYQLRNNLYPQLESSLKEELNRLSNDIKTLITSGKKVQGRFVPMLSQVFNLRIKAIKWLATGTNFNYLEILKDIVPQIEDLKTNKKMEVLTENLLFALRCNQRVAEAVIRTNETTNDTLTQLPEITYEQFIASLSIAIPDDETVQKFVHLTNTSLHIEFVMLAADIIGDDNLKVSDKTINELAFLVADAAQEYIAIATELGILKSRSSIPSFSTESFDNSFIKEQKQLADLGLDDFASNFLD